MKYHVYSTEDNSHVATISGSSNEAIDKAFNRHFDINSFGGTYSPAFGAGHGLVENDEAEEIDADLPEPVASIADADGNRIYLSITQDPDGFYVAAHNGDDASQYRFKSAEEAKDSISSVWAGALWDLQYN